MTMAQSSTERASGPQWSKVYELGMTPARLTRPKVGIRANHTAQRGRTADRAASIGAQRHRHQPCGHGRAGATRGAAGKMRQMPRIARRRPRADRRTARRAQIRAWPACPSGSHPASQSLRVAVASASGMRLRQTLECPDVRIPWCHRCPSTRMVCRAAARGMRRRDLVFGLLGLLARQVERRRDIGVQLRRQKVSVRPMSASTYSTGRGST